MDLQVKCSGGAGEKHSGRFQVEKVEPYRRRFILAIDAVDGNPGDVWVLPSAVFDAYVTRPPNGSPRDLDLDDGTRKYGLKLRELLCGFKNRWELIVDYGKHEAFMNSTEDLGEILMVDDAQETPTEEVITLEGYDSRRRGPVRRYIPRYTRSPGVRLLTSERLPQGSDCHLTIST